MLEEESPYLETRRLTLASCHLDLTSWTKLLLFPPHFHLSSLHLLHHLSYYAALFLGSVFGLVVY